MAVALVVSIVMKIGECLVAPVGRQFGYLIYYERNVVNFKEQVRKLKDKRSDVQIEVDAAKSKSDIIKPTVEGWLKRVDELSKDADKFHEDEVIAKKGCLKGWCPNLKSSYSLSRKAKKQTQDVEKLCGEGNFSGVSLPAAAPAVGTTFAWMKDFQEFGSRSSIMSEIMKSLEDDSINMIGICGMGGVGKTTMVKKVAKIVEDKKMFDKIVVVVVSQNPDLINIQGEIAKTLGFELSGGTNPFARAGDLGSKILRIGRVLVILDDVWKRLELDDIGIPFGNHHKGCKIVLTSRSENVCNSMDTRKNFKVGILGEEEAWNLFKEMAGISNEGTSHPTDLQSTQMAVAKECGGLPIAIVTVGRALRCKSKNSWDSARKQLSKSMVKNITGVDEMVFKPLELSYNYLESEEAKKCFLLCSLYPEDFYIPIEDLVRYGIGLELFERIDSVGEARDRVHSLVNDLQQCYLLLDGERGESIKMHDVVRDVAISIASRQHSFMVRCDKVLEDWPEKDHLKNYSVISLKLNGMHGLPGNFEFPTLQLLQLDCNAGLPPISYDLNEGMEDVKVQETPGSFYQGMKELRVLALSDMYGSLPTSLGRLTNLRTLSLFHCRLIDDDVSVIGALENLEILSFAGSCIKELPKELIGHLGHLKVLDLLSCKVERIYPGVLSSLSKLEELYIGCSFQSWCEVEESKERAKAIIDEVASLPNLIVLDITLLNINFWPRGLVIEKLKKFKIGVGFNLTYIPKPRYLLSNQMRFKVLNMSDIIETGLNKLLKSTGNLRLKRVDGLKNLLCDLVMNGDGFEYLTNLSLKCCDNLEYLINTTDEVPQRAFPVLESLDLSDLCDFKGIISHDCRLPNKAFSALKELYLESLPKLTNLWKGPTQLLWLGNLTLLYVTKCNKLLSLFSLSIIRNLMHLDDITISQCGMMEEIVSSEEREHEIATTITDKIELPKLRELSLHSLPNFTAICKAMNAIELPQLSFLELENIPKLKSIFPTSDSESNYDTIIQPLFNNKFKLTTIERLIISQMDNLVELWPNELLQAKIRKMTVRSCPKLSNILFSSNSIKGMQNLELLEVEVCQSMQVVFDLKGLVDREDISNIALPSLKKVKLTHLPKLTHVWKEMDNSPGIQGFQNLSSLIVKGCDNLTNLLSSSLAKLLVKLQEMEVAECDAMEAIFANESREEVTTNTIMFPQLNSLKLSDLPNLRSFCFKAYKFEGSLLKSVEVINCPNMKALPPPFQRKLEQQRSNQEAVQMANFSTSDQDCLVDGKLFINVLGDWKLTFTEIDEPTELLELGRGWLDYRRLMMVRNCGKLLSVISSNLMQELKNLEGLEVWYCDSLEVIFDFEEVCATTATAEEFGTSIPPPLRNLDLKYLPKLTHIWKIFPQQIQCFQNLRNLRVERCDSLRYIFTFFMAKALVNLKYLTIAHCHNLEKIITKEDEGGEEDEERGKIKIIFITLEDLPSLVCIGIPDFQIDINFLNANSCPKFRGWNPNSAPGGVPTVDRQF